MKTLGREGPRRGYENFKEGEAEEEEGGDQNFVLKSRVEGGIKTLWREGPRGGTL